MRSVAYGTGIQTRCDECAEHGFWAESMQSPSDLALSFIANRYSPFCLELGNDCGMTYDREMAMRIIDGLESLSYPSILEKIDSTDYQLKISEVPLFGDFYNASKGMIDYLSEVGKATYLDAGGHFTHEFNNALARRKYGEEHLKLSAQLGFVKLVRGSSQYSGTLTPLGIVCEDMGQRRFDRIVRKLIFRVPVVAKAMKLAKDGPVIISEMLSSTGMKESTVGRRTTAIKLLFKEIELINDESIQKRIISIGW